MSLANGTSFSTPEIAGMVACLWQALPNLTNMELRQLIMESSSLYPLHEDQRGYGIPDAWLLLATIWIVSSILIIRHLLLEVSSLVLIMIS